MHIMRVKKWMRVTYDDARMWQNTVTNLEEMSLDLVKCNVHPSVPEQPP